MSAIIMSAVGRHARFLQQLSCGGRAFASVSSSSSASAISSPTQLGGASVQSSRASYGTCNTNNPTALLSVAAVTSLAAAVSISSSISTSCETTTGPADEREEKDEVVVVTDGMDASSGASQLNIASADTGPAEAEEDDEDDPSNDEETTCSICLINRQGPCRKYWLKFERCMKEHSAEQEKSKAKTARAEEDDGTNKEISDDNTELTKQEEVENEWDAFMEKSTKPGEDDDDEEEDEDDDDEDDEEEGDDKNENGEEDSSSSILEDMTLAERCDKFMIPWIGCIQEHRNIYSLISNDFYQKDYVDPLEDAVPESRRQHFSIEVDLENWREHVEADADAENEDLLHEEDTPKAPLPNADELHLINGYAKFPLKDPVSGEPIEVAYIKDQKGRLLGFDSFTKKKSSSDNESVDDENNNNIDEEEINESEGECTFHLVPGETSIVTAYAIYRGRRIDEDGESIREDTLFYTSEIHLPGAK